MTSSVRASKQAATKKRSFLIAIVALCTLAICARFGPYLLARIGAPVTYGEADRDQDGWVSPAEASYIIDAGQRSFQVGSDTCIEYFALKDGLPIKRVCR